MHSIFLHHLTRRSVRLITIGLLLALLAALPRSGYSAPTATTRYVAPGGGDGNNCLSLLTACEHIQAAIDKSRSGDAIQIAAGIYLENLAISDKSLTLQGAGSATTIIDGSNQERILFLTDEDTNTLMSVVISGLTLQNGKSELGGAINNETASIILTVSNSEIANNTATAAGGGGIFNNGFLNLINVVIRGNTANSYGGGIYNLGKAELNGTTVANNNAGAGGGIRNTNLMTITNSLIGPDNRSDGNNGGGIYNVWAGSRLTLINSTVSNNEAEAATGGGIYNDNILISSGTLISGNLATQQGGGIYNATSGRVTFSRGSLRANRSLSDAGGALFNAGTANLTGALVTNNQASDSGGGVNNTGSLSIDTNTISSNTAAGQPGGGINNQGTLTLTRSALIYNVASVSQGGGLNNIGTARLTNVTVSNNTAASGGGIYNGGGTLSLQFSTVGDNSAPSLNNFAGGVTVGNSILAQSAGNACGGTITSAGYNMDTGASCGFSATGDQSSVALSQLQLGPVQDNGGGTLTRAIDFSSSAVDSAGPCPPPATDQRGIVRPKSSACDRGAYEVMGYPSSGSPSIGPNQCVISGLTINDQGAVGRMLVGVNLTHPDRSKLTIRLLSPGFPKVTLFAPAGTAAELDTLLTTASGPVPLKS
jgi:hypothetical protein